MTEKDIFPPNCWACGVTAKHHTLVNTPDRYLTDPAAGEWMCFPCAHHHRPERLF